MSTSHIAQGSTQHSAYDMQGITEDLIDRHMDMCIDTHARKHVRSHPCMHACTMHASTHSTRTHARMYMCSGLGHRSPHRSAYLTETADRACRRFFLLHHTHMRGLHIDLSQCLTSQHIVVTDLACGSLRRPPIGRGGSYGEIERAVSACTESGAYQYSPIEVPLPEFAEAGHCSGRIVLTHAERGRLPRL